MSEYILVPKDDDLYHYGVLGMKWGVRRANRKYESIKKLKVKAANYDKKSAQMTKRSEKAHAKYDLEEANKKAVKAANYEKKAAKYEKKAAKAANDSDRASYDKKSKKLAYKASKAKIDANRISKTKGYGYEAMKYSVKSDKLAKKAANARRKIANNEYYVSMMNRKISMITDDDLKTGYAFINEMKEW